MQYKIGGRGSVEFGFNEMTLTVRCSWGHTLLLFGVTVVGTACQIFTWGNYSEQETRMKYIGFIISGAIILFMVFQLIKALLYSENYRIDLKGCVLTKERVFISFVLKTTQIEWDKDSYFKYENIYDSYKRVTDIWLVAISNTAHKSTRLIRFFDSATFKAFRQLFNEHFPDNEIMEWHD